MQTNREVFVQGMKDAFPIGIGYFAVAFSLGITARDCGFNAFQGFLSSYTSYASAGQYIGYTLYAANSTLAQMFIMMIITNLRYLLMGFALNQRIPAGTPLRHRFMIGWSITDELFGLNIARPGYIHPYYGIGAWFLACPMWSVGTALGITVGNLLPLRLVSALSVALFGMFLAIIIPPSRKDKVVGVCVAVSFAASLGANYVPVISGLSAGNRTIILTVVISAVAAALFPRRTQVIEEPVKEGGEEIAG